MIYLLTAVMGALLWRLHLRQDAAEAAEAARTVAVLDALRGIAKPLAEEFQYTIGTIREDSARHAITTVNDAIETIENTQP